MLHHCSTMAGASTATAAAITAVTDAAVWGSNTPPRASASRQKAAASRPFAIADQRSLRYASQLGAANFANAPPAFFDAASSTSPGLRFGYTGSMTGCIRLQTPARGLA